MLFANDPAADVFKRHVSIRELPPVPNTGWTPPRELPNLDSAVRISFDCETYDPFLTDDGPIAKQGPGWARGKGHIVGVSVGAVDALGNTGAWYLPVRHTVGSEVNLPTGAVFRWLHDVLSNPRTPKVGANLIYDIGWLAHENIYVNGELHDVQFAEALLHEDGHTNLEYLGRKYCGEGKDSSLMYDWLAAAYGGAADSKQRRNIHRTPPQLVGAYAESDASLPLRVLDAQLPLLAAEGLGDVYRMECDLIYLLVRMRMAGVHIDLNKAEQLYDDLGRAIPSMYDAIGNEYGYRIESTSNANLGRLFDRIGIKYGRTENGQPSMRKDWLKALDHPVGKAIIDIREHEKLRGTFLKSYLLDAHVNGFVYCNFHPLRGEDEGTRSGRFASNVPNLQNIPSRTPLGKQIRQAFVPDPGHSHWKKYDYSQIEYRMLVHHAVGDGSDDVRARFNAEPDRDWETNA